MRRFQGTDVLWALAALVVACIVGFGIASIVNLRTDFDASAEDRAALSDDVEVLRDNDVALREQLDEAGLTPSVAPLPPEPDPVVSDRGDRGETGAKGDKGDTGVGITGADGATVVGSDGRDGRDPPCLSSPSQCQGINGNNGNNGLDSTVPGPAGPECRPGYTGGDRPAPLPSTEVWFICVKDPP